MVAKQESCEGKQHTLNNKSKEHPGEGAPLNNDNVNMSAARHKTE